MNKAKQKEMEADISFLRQQYQGINQQIGLPETLKAERLMERLDHPPTSKPAWEWRAFSGRRLAMACMLVLVVGIAAWFTRYGALFSGGGFTKVETEEAMEATAESLDEAASQAEAYALDEAAPQAEAYELGEAGYSMNEELPAGGADGAKMEAAPDPSLAENRLLFQRSGPAAPVPAVSRDEIKTAILNSLNQEGTEEFAPDLLSAQGTDSGTQPVKVGEVAVQYEEETGTITLSQGDQQQSFSVQPYAELMTGESTLCVAEQKEGAVEVTLYWVRQSVAAEKLLSCEQQGVYEDLMFTGGDSYTLLTQMEVTKEDVEQDAFLPMVDGKEIEPDTVQIVHGGTGAPRFSVSTNLSENEISSSAMLLVP